MPRHQNSVVRSIIEQVFCFNLRKTHQDFDFFLLPKVSMCPWYFLILSEHCQLVIKEKDPPDALIHILQIIENWTNLVATRITILIATENWTNLVATRILILVATENWTILCCDEIYFSLFVVIFWRTSNSRRNLWREWLTIRRELLDSLLEFSNSRRNLDENCWIRGENPVKSRQPNCIPYSSVLWILKYGVKLQTWPQTIGRNVDLKIIHKLFY